MNTKIVIWKDECYGYFSHHTALRLYKENKLYTLTMGEYIDIHANYAVIDDITYEIQLVINNVDKKETIAILVETGI